MRAFLSGNHPVQICLRQQYEQSSISGRKRTPTGVYADFAVPPWVPRVDPPSFYLLNVVVEFESESATAQLAVADGALCFLELCVFEGAWPEHPVVRAIHASPEPRAF